VLASFFVKIGMLGFRQGALSMMAWLVIAGIPPFALFWLKANLFLILAPQGLFLRV